MRSRYQKTNKISDEEIEGLVLTCAELVYNLYGKKDKLYEYSCPASAVRSPFLNLLVETTEFGYVRRQLTNAQLDLMDSVGRGRYYRIQQAIDRLAESSRMVAYPVKVRVTIGRREIEREDKFYRPTNVLEQIALQADS